MPQSSKQIDNRFSYRVPSRERMLILIKQLIRVGSRYPTSHYLNSVCEQEETMMKSSRLLMALTLFVSCGMAGVTTRSLALRASW